VGLVYSTVSAALDTEHVAALNLRNWPKKDHGRSVDVSCSCASGLVGDRHRSEMSEKSDTVRLIQMSSNATLSCKPLLIGLVVEGKLLNMLPTVTLIEHTLECKISIMGHRK
jgi:hypothetical protein